MISRIAAALSDVKHWIDGVSIGTAVATLAGYLPAIAAALSIIWTAIRIYETKTVQGWIGKSRRHQSR